jgi:hypothetical protein
MPRSAADASTRAAERRQRAAPGERGERHGLRAVGRQLAPMTYAPVAPSRRRPRRMSKPDSRLNVDFSTLCGGLLGSAEVQLRTACSVAARLVATSYTPYLVRARASTRNCGTAQQEPSSSRSDLLRRTSACRDRAGSTCRTPSDRSARPQAEHPRLHSSTREAPFKTELFIGRARTEVRLQTGLSRSEVWGEPRYPSDERASSRLADCDRA